MLFFCFAFLTYFLKTIILTCFIHIRRFFNNKKHVLRINIIIYISYKSYSTH